MYHLMFTEGLSPFRLCDHTSPNPKVTERMLWHYNVCRNPSQPTGHPWSFLSPDLPLGVKLRDVFTSAFPRASHHPAAFCVLLPDATCSRHRLSHEIKAIIGNTDLFVKRDLHKSFCFCSIAAPGFTKTSLSVSDRSSRYSYPICSNPLSCSVSST